MREILESGYLYHPKIDVSLTTSDVCWLSFDRDGIIIEKSGGDRIKLQFEKMDVEFGAKILSTFCTRTHVTEKKEVTK
jgi:hypothetical protein